VLLWCIKKMPNCICRRKYMWKCAKIMKMFWQNFVLQCAKVTTNNNTNHELPFLKIIFQLWPQRLTKLLFHTPRSTLLSMYYQLYIYIYHMRTRASPYRQHWLSVQFTYTHNKIIVLVYCWRWVKTNQCCQSLWP
jgi:hypothetical protein